MSISSTVWGTSSWIDSGELMWVTAVASGVSTDVVLYQLYTDEVYVYAAHSAGLSIIDLRSEDLICYAESSLGFTSIVGNSEKVYLGTTASGVFYFDKSVIYGTKDSLGDISSVIYPLATTYLPSCSEVKFLTIYDCDLAVVTAEGLDIIGMAAGKEFKSSTTSSGITKSFLTSKKEVYYLENLGTWSLCKTKPYLCDWDSPTVRYKTKQSFLKWVVDLSDLFITESTSLNGVDNTVFMATSSGIYVYDEGTGATDIYL